MIPRRHLTHTWSCRFKRFFTTAGIPNQQHIELDAQGRAIVRPREEAELWVARKEVAAAADVTKGDKYLEFTKMRDMLQPLRQATERRFAKAKEEGIEEMKRMRKKDPAFAPDFKNTHAAAELKRLPHQERFQQAFGVPSHHQPEETGPLQFDKMLSNGESRSLDMIDKLDILARSLHKHQDPMHDDWKTLYHLYRSSVFVTELVRLPTDVLPPGDTLMLDLTKNREGRRPYLYQIDNGPLVLPVFTFTQIHMSRYFEINSIYEAYWNNTIPKTGRHWERFKDMPMPVIGAAPLVRLLTLAYAAANPHKVVVCVNPGSENAKLLTYPELLFIGEGTKDKDLWEKTKPFRQTFKSSRWKGIRHDPRTLPKLSFEEIIVPRVARDELRLLLVNLLEVQSIFVTVAPNSKDSSNSDEFSVIITAQVSEIAQHVPDSTTPEVILKYEDERDKNVRKGQELCTYVREYLSQYWSFLGESKRSVRLTVTETPLIDVQNSFQLLGKQDMHIFRKGKRGEPLQSALGFNEPLTDSEA